MFIQRIEKLIFFALIAIIAFTVVPTTNFASAASEASASNFGGKNDDEKGRGRGRGDRKGGRGRDSERDNYREARRQDRKSDHEIRRQQQWNGWNSGRQQWESDRRSRRQQRESDRRSQNSYRDNYGSGRRYDRNVYYAPQPQWRPWFPNWGQQVRQDRHWRNEQRKAWKQQRKAERRYERGQRKRYRDSYYNYYNYNNTPQYNYDYYEPDRSSVKQQLIRNLLGSFLGGGQLGGFEQLIPNRGYNYVEPRNVYRPSYVYNPQYELAQPQYYDADYGYDNGLGSGVGGLLGALPVAELIQQFAGDNEFVSAIAGNLLTQGYDQGYYAGQYARDIGYRNAVYNDPYADTNGNCYLSSSSIGDNRALLSQGYELGYRDAMQGSNNYANQFGGIEGDLVSTLLSNAISGI